MGERTKGEQNQKLAAVDVDEFADGGAAGVLRNGKGECWGLAEGRMHVSVHARVQQAGAAFLRHALHRGIRQLMEQRRTPVCARVDNASRSVVLQVDGQGEPPWEEEQLSQQDRDRKRMLACHRLYWVLPLSGGLAHRWGPAHRYMMSVARQHRRE